jgi:hypothetical protein
MKFKEIVGRLTGFSVPIFGVSWNPPEPEVKKAHRIITFLEDRRVLYNPSEIESPHHCVRSVVEIRHFLTDEISTGPAESQLVDSLRAMRSASRKFLDAVGERDGEIVRFGAHDGHYASWAFISALGELRGVFGVYLASIATTYGVDIEDDLASILPVDHEEGAEAQRLPGRAARLGPGKPKGSKKA